MRPARRARATGSDASTESAPQALKIFPQSLSPPSLPVCDERLYPPRKRCSQSIPKTNGKLAEACLGRVRLVGPIGTRIQRTLRANVDDISEVMFELLEQSVEGQQYILDDLRSQRPVCPLAKIERRFEPWPDDACRQTAWLGKVVSVKEQDAVPLLSIAHVDQVDEGRSDHVH